MSRSNGGEGREANPKVCASIIGAPQTVTHISTHPLDAAVATVHTRAMAAASPVRRALPCMLTRPWRRSGGGWETLQKTKTKKKLLNTGGWCPASLLVSFFLFWVM